jgi:hypothetical protein
MVTKYHWFFYQTGKQSAKSVELFCWFSHDCTLKPQISFIFHFARASDGQMAHVLGVYSVTDALFWNAQTYHSLWSVLKLSDWSVLKLSDLLGV